MSSHNAATVAALDQLEKALPDMIKAYPEEGDFWNAFAGASDAIAEGAAAGDAEYARGRIDCMLKNVGMIPGEEEGSPCK